MSEKKFTVKNAFTVKNGPEDHLKVEQFIENNPEFHHHENARQFFNDVLARYTELKNGNTQVTTANNQEFDSRISELEAKNIKLHDSLMESNAELNRLRNEKTSPEIQPNQLILEFSQEKVCTYFRDEIIPAAIHHKIVKAGGDLFANFLNAFQSQGFEVNKPGFIPASGTKIKDLI